MKTTSYDRGYDALLRQCLNRMRKNTVHWRQRDAVGKRGKDETITRRKERNKILRKGVSMHLPFFAKVKTCGSACLKGSVMIHLQVHTMALMQNACFDWKKTCCWRELSLKRMKHFHMMLTSSETYLSSALGLSSNKCCLIRFVQAVLWFLQLLITLT